MSRDLPVVDTQPVERPPGALQAVPRQQALWIGAGTLAAVVLGALGLWQSDPGLVVSLALGAGVSLINPRRWWVAPLAAAIVVASGLAADALRLPAVLGAGAAAGVLAAWLVPHQADWMDYLNGLLGGAAGASLGLWAAATLLPDASPVVEAGLTAGVVSLVASQALVPLALSFDAIRLPSRREVRRTLAAAYRTPVFRAFDLYLRASRTVADRKVKRGLAEVATWVYQLEAQLQTLDAELAEIDVVAMTQRIDAFENDESDDTFTRERRLATAEHLRKVLEHRRANEVDRRRTDALVDYALAYLEEARAGQAVARQLPGERAPDRLPEVLHRLRTHAAEGDARRRTQREMQALQV